MSVLYRVLKPIVRKLVKDGSHQEETYEEFVESSRKIQAKFRFKLPEKKGYEFRDEIIDGCHCIIGHKTGSDTGRALVYLVGGGERRWQLPGIKSMIRYISETDRDLIMPLYPLYPDHDFLDEVEMICDLHKHMLSTYEAENIAWLGFSAGADLIMSSGRHIVKVRKELPMPGLMIPVSPCNLKITEESYARMKEIEKRDIMMSADAMKIFPEYYDHDHSLPTYLCGCAAEDDYTGFPKIVMYFGGDEIFAGEAPEYEKAFIRCDVKDYTIHVAPGMFHAYPMFTFLKEGKQGEDELVELLKK